MADIKLDGFVESVEDAALRYARYEYGDSSSRKGAVESVEESANCTSAVLARLISHLTDKGLLAGEELEKVIRGY